MEPLELQKDKVMAAADLVGRAGATAFEIGYIPDLETSADAWYAHAQYRGARIMVEDHPSPGDAAEALARRLLTGARCSCGKLVALQAGGAVAFERPTMADGSAFPLAEAVRVGQCRWTRRGTRWERACS